MRSVAFFTTLAVVVGFASEAFAVVPVWGQCGGNGYSGETTCASGSTCVKSNDWYSQCLPGSNVPTTTATPTTVVTTKTTTTTSPTSGSSNGSCSNRTKFKYFGVNESGAEFGDGKWPGVLGTDYTWPSPSSIDYFVGKGMNSFRVPFMLERMSPNGVAGSFDSTYLSGLKTIVNYITGKGAYAIIEPHNYLRYKGTVFSSTSDFKSFWTKLATEFKSNANVVFDIINEPNGVDASVAFNFNQAAVDGIRSTGASQLILVEGTSWTGAHSWTTSGNSNYFAKIQDPLNNWAVEMHQYLDSDSSGTSATCVSATIGAERVAAATQWCKANNVKCFLGELGAGSNDVCIAAVKNTLCALQQAGGVWIGVTWWAAGPWWGDYFTSIEPPSGTSTSRILPEALLPFL